MHQNASTLQSCAVTALIAAPKHGKFVDAYVAKLPESYTATTASCHTDVVIHMYEEEEGARLFLLAILQFLPAQLSQACSTNLLKSGNSREHGLLRIVHSQR